ncbi:MAG: ribonuclease III domain-containing protein [Candidatus Thorarchaeota archaeon]
MKQKKTIAVLSWKPIHIEEKLKRLFVRVQKTQRITPVNNTRLLNKIDRWVQDMGYIQDCLKRIRENLVPDLEGLLGVDFSSPELIQVAMFQPSTKNIFSELETQYKGSDDDPLGQDGFGMMTNLSEMAKVLALVGDGVISSAVIQHLWKPHLSNAGEITLRKAEIVSNENMAKLCDEWNLYEYRIHFDPDVPSKSEVEHDKGTLVEAIYGIVYIEHEYKRVVDLVRHLINIQ